MRETLNLSLFKQAPPPEQGAGKQRWTPPTVPKRPAPPPFQINAQKQVSNGAISANHRECVLCIESQAETLRNMKQSTQQKVIAPEGTREVRK